MLGNKKTDRYVVRVDKDVLRKLRDKYGRRLRYITRDFMHGLLNEEQDNIQQEDETEDNMKEEAEKLFESMSIDEIKEIMKIK